MNKPLAEYAHMPNVTINGRVFVDKEMMKDLLIDEIKQDIKHCDSQDEICGMEQAIIRIENL